MMHQDKDQHTVPKQAKANGMPLAHFNGPEEWWEVLTGLKNDAASAREALGLQETLRQDELDLWNE